MEGGEGWNRLQTFHSFRSLLYLFKSKMNSLTKLLLTHFISTPFNHHYSSISRAVKNDRDRYIHTYKHTNDNILILSAVDATTILSLLELSWGHKKWKISNVKIYFSKVRLVMIR